MADRVDNMAPGLGRRKNAAPANALVYPIGQFSVNPIPLVVGLIANTAAAVVSAILMRRERHKASIILAFGTGILVFFGLGLVNVFNW
jgi:hypothetical protein